MLEQHAFTKNNDAGQSGTRTPFTNSDLLDADSTSIYKEMTVSDGSKHSALPTVEVVFDSSNDAGSKKNTGTTTEEVKGLTPQELEERERIKMLLSDDKRWEIEQLKNGKKDGGDKNPIEGIDEVSKEDVLKAIEDSDLSDEEKEMARRMVEAMTEDKLSDAIDGLANAMEEKGCDVDMKKVVDAVEDAFEENGVKVSIKTWDGNIATLGKIISKDGDVYTDLPRPPL